MDQSTIFLTICGMAAVTALPRILPALALASRPLPQLLTRWLSFVPAAVLSALLFPALLLQDGKLRLSLDNVYLLAAVPSMLVAWRFKSFFGAIAAGMAAAALLRLVVG